MRRGLMVMLVLGGLGFAAWYFFLRQPAGAAAGPTDWMAGLVGLPEAEAQKLARQNKYTIRVLARDGQVVAGGGGGTSAKRINVALANSVVSTVLSIG